MAHQLEASEVFQDRDRAAAEDFHSLLGGRLVAVGQVTDRSDGAIGEFQSGEQVVHAVLPGIPQALGLHFHGRPAGEKAEEIHKMTGLAQNASASNFRIIHPMIRREVAGVHPVVDGQRFVDRGQKLLQLNGHRRESPVEADHQ